MITTGGYWGKTLKIGGVDNERSIYTFFLYILK